MKRFLANLRAALDAQYDRELDHLRGQRPWLKDYDFQAPIRGWYAVHKPTGTTIGPAKNITDLDRQILADHQSRPIRPRPVPLPLPERDDEDATRLDIPGWPYRRNAS